LNPITRIKIGTRMPPPPEHNTAQHSTASGIQHAQLHKHCSGSKRQCFTRCSPMPPPAAIMSPSAVKTSPHPSS
jgi:hypothetical protein